MRRMDYETFKWIRVVHIYAILSWTGALVGLSFILRQHSRAAEAARADFIQLEKGTAIAMDISALISMAIGIVMLVVMDPSPMKGGGYMHAKLTLVALMVGIHGMQRIRVGKYKRGEVSAEPAWIIPVLEAAILAIIVLVVAKPF